MKYEKENYPMKKINKKTKIFLILAPVLFFAVFLAFNATVAEAQTFNKQIDYLGPRNTSYSVSNTSYPFQSRDDLYFYFDDVLVNDGSLRADFNFVSGDSSRVKIISNRWVTNSLGHMVGYRMTLVSDCIELDPDSPDCLKFNNYRLKISFSGNRYETAVPPGSPRVRIPTMSRIARVNPATGVVQFDLRQYPRLINLDKFTVSARGTIESEGEQFNVNMFVGFPGSYVDTFTMPVSGSSNCPNWGRWDGSCKFYRYDGGTPQDPNSLFVTSSYQDGILSINYNFTGRVSDGAGESFDITFTLPGGTYAYLGSPSITFTADNTNLSYGGSTNLRWFSSNTNSCSASGAWSGGKPTSGAQNTGSLTSSKTYTLSCSGAGGSITKSVTVNVAPPTPPSVSLSANPTSIQLGQSSSLSWSVGGIVSSCNASGGWSGSKSQSGSQNVSPQSTGSHTYTLSCSGPGGSDSKSRTINVSDPSPSADIKANGSDGPLGIGYAQSATISWSSVYSQFPQYGGSCSVNPGGFSGTSGSRSTGLLKTSESYSVSCDGALGRASDSVRVNVAAPTLSSELFANPPTDPQNPPRSSWTTTLVTNVGGTAIGTINYSLWWNCNNGTSNVQTASNACGSLPAVSVGNCAENSNGVKCEALGSQTLSRPHTFICSAGAGQCSFRPKVIVERDSLTAVNALGAPLITVQEPPRFFRLEKSGDLEAGVSVNPFAESNKIQITANPFNLFDAPVNLSVESGLPKGGTGHFGTSGASAAGFSAPYPQSTDFWVIIPRGTAEGSYTIKVRGVGGGVSDTTDVLLNVVERLPDFKEI